MKYFFILVTALGLTACGPSPVSSNADRDQSKHQEKLQQQANAVVGMPSITRFREKKLLKMIYEMRDSEISTVTYTIDMNGSLHKMCDSVGYGIPYATQFTNPQVDTYYTSNSNVHVAMPQADPNGLFSPAAADGTWVMCSDGKGSTKPVFFEPRIIVSPFPLK